MKQIISEINQFRKERDWRQFHNEKDLALSVTLEASELLENFQWKTSQEAIDQNFENIQEELADVLIYTLMLVDNLELDPNQLIRNKLIKNAEKYPVEIYKGSKEKYVDMKKER